jgi:HK97 family phage major capsid protein
MQTNTVHDHTGQMLGLSDREAGEFSFMRAIRAMAFPEDRRVQQAAGFEREASEAWKRTTGRAGNGIFVPHDVLVYQQRGKRTNMVVGTGNVGGYLKGTDQATSFIDALRAKSVVIEAGAMEMNGLVGDVAVPRIATSSVASWVAEDTAVSQTNPVLGQMSLSPKMCGAYVDISKKLLAQATPSAENLVQHDLAATIALAIDRAALHGAGGNEPTGIIGTAGVASVAAGTNGGAPTLPLVVAVESALATANGDQGALAWVTNPKVRGKLRQVFLSSYGSDALWQQTAADGASINGVRAFCTNQVRSDMVKNTSGAVCSGLFFGNWQDLIVATWSGLELLVDPFSLSTTGQLRVVAIHLVDIGVRRPASFAVMSDILTA